MAVHGATPSSIVPARYRSISAGSRNLPKITLKNSQAKKAMVKGFIAQLAIRVSPTGLGERAAFIISPQLI